MIKYTQESNINQNTQKQIHKLNNNHQQYFDFHSITNKQFTNQLLLSLIDQNIAKLENNHHQQIKIQNIYQEFVHNPLKKMKIINNNHSKKLILLKQFIAQIKLKSSNIWNGKNKKPQRLLLYKSQKYHNYSRRTKNLFIKEFQKRPRKDKLYKSAYKPKLQERKTYNSRSNPMPQEVVPQSESPIQENVISQKLFSFLPHSGSQNLSKFFSSDSSKSALKLKMRLRSSVASSM